MLLISLGKLIAISVAFQPRSLASYPFSLSWQTVLWDCWFFLESPQFLCHRECVEHCYCSEHKEWCKYRTRCLFSLLSPVLPKFSNDSWKEALSCWRKRNVIFAFTEFLHFRKTVEIEDRRKWINSSFTQHNYSSPTEFDKWYQIMNCHFCSVHQDA